MFVPALPAPPVCPGLLFPSALAAPLPPFPPALTVTFPLAFPVPSDTKNVPNELFPFAAATVATMFVPELSALTNPADAVPPAPPAPPVDPGPLPVFPEVPVLPPAKVKTANWLIAEGTV
jgi:hypothetical protein